MTDLRDEHAGAPHIARKALFIATGIAFITGGTLAWQLGSSSGSQGQEAQPTSMSLPGSSAGHTDAPSLSDTPTPYDRQNPGSAMGSTSNNATTRVTVNGQDVPVASDGHVHKTIRSNSSETIIDVTVESSSNTSVGGARAD